MKDNDSIQQLSLNDDRHYDFADNADFLSEREDVPF
jgi:hypothetical protein